LGKSLFCNKSKKTATYQENRFRMRKIVILLALTFGIFTFAQETANRFFYNLTYKPKKDSDSLLKEMMILDITKDKSIYRDYSAVSQDSLIKDQMEKMQRSGQFNPDFQKMFKQPKFSATITKAYPSMKMQYVEMIFGGMAAPMYISYSENLKFDWKVEPDTLKIGEYNTQKATTEFGGRKWTAWFSADLPFQDGPYKFSGLPGLIVKIEDEGKNYSWELEGNKNIKDFQEKTYMETLMNMGDPKDLPKKEFLKKFNQYKKDPFGSVRQYWTPEVMNQTMPGTTKKIGDYIKEQERALDELYNSINNPIELNEE